MSTFVRYNNVLIDTKKLLWVGANNATLVFRFENQANDLTFTYTDANTAQTELTRFETLLLKTNNNQNAFGMFGNTGSGFNGIR